MMKRIFVPTENKSDRKSKENGEGDLPESCIEKCPVGSQCVGEERYRKYMKGRERNT